MKNVSGLEKNISDIVKNKKDIMPCLDRSVVLSAWKALQKRSFLVTGYEVPGWAY